MHTDIIYHFDMTISSDKRCEQKQIHIFSFLKLTPPRRIKSTLVWRKGLIKLTRYLGKLVMFRYAKDNAFYCTLNLQVFREDLAACLALRIQKPDRRNLLSVEAMTIFYVHPLLPYE